MIVICPHCGDPIEILEVNCAIFRHAWIIETNQQLDPHAPKEVCDRLLAAGFLYGCGKPFRLENGKAVACDYI